MILQAALPFKRLNRNLKPTSFSILQSTIHRFWALWDGSISCRLISPTVFHIFANSKRSAAFGTSFKLNLMIASCFVMTSSEALIRWLNSILRTTFSSIRGNCRPTKKPPFLAATRRDFMDWRHFEDILDTFSVRFRKCTIDRTSLCKAAGPHHHPFFPLGSRGEPQRHSDSAPQSGLWPLRLSVLIYSDCLFWGIFHCCVPCRLARRAGRLQTRHSCRTCALCHWRSVVSSHFVPTPLWSFSLRA